MINFYLDKQNNSYYYFLTIFMEVFSMKKIFVAVLVVMAFSVSAFAADEPKMYDPSKEAHKLVIKMNLLDVKKDKAIGEVIAVETPYGVAFYPNLTFDAANTGNHGFHVHANADCGSSKEDKAAGKLGMKAGGHWDPANTKMHSYPWMDNGHKGDLPALYINKEGMAKNPVLAPKIKTLAELKGHALMVHVGGDNHHDHPAALGGGGARMACGVIK